MTGAYGTCAAACAHPVPYGRVLCSFHEALVATSTPRAAVAPTELASVYPAPTQRMRRLS